MRLARDCIIALIACVSIHTGALRRAHGDGLIFRLPPEGTQAEFRVELSATTQAVLSDKLKATLPPDERDRPQPKKEIKMTGTVTITALGRVHRALQDWRWIEMTRVLRASDGEPSTNVLQILVAEEHLKRGEHPLDHALETLFNPKQRDAGDRASPKGFNRIQYELERFLPVFPPPLNHQKRVADRKVETPAGVYSDCEEIVGTTQFDLPLLNSGRWTSKTDWSIALHPDAPFGVVELRSQSRTLEIAEDGGCFEINSQQVLTLAAIKRDAKGVANDQLRGH